MHHGEKHDRHVILRSLVTARLPTGSLVYVDHWYGCDEDWGDPVYVDGFDPNGNELIDAVADLDSASLEDQADYIADQLLHG